MHAPMRARKAASRNRQFAVVRDHGGMEFHILGPLEVIGPRGPIEIGSTRQRAILALLVLRVGQTVTTDRLIEEVWGDDPPPSAQHALGVHVSGLRRALGSDRIETQRNGYRLRPAGSDVDLQRFEALTSDAAAASSKGDLRTATARYSAALALWRGPALGDLALGATTQGERTRLDELRTLALQQRIDADLALGRHAELVPELRRVVGELPLREAFHVRLMLALYRSGRQADALEAYHQARVVLSRELGVEPGQELEAMQRAVLDHDRSFYLPRPAEPVASQEVEAPAPDSAASAGEPQLDRAAGGARRVVTTLVAEVHGSSSMGEPLDPESARDPMNRGIDKIRAVLERHGGKVDRVVGDAVMAVFGLPRTHEDDALRAVRSAWEMRDVLAGLNDQLDRELGVRLTVRVGINTGEVVAARHTAAPGRVTGDPVNLAVRLGQAAGPGDILLGSGTYDIVRWAVDAEPAGATDAGRSGPSRAFRLLAVSPGIASHAQRFDSQLVGRERERRLLDYAFEQSIADETCHLFTLLGPAGVGKSRLVHEFLRSVREDSSVLRGRCLPYGERDPLWPVAEAIKQGAGIGDAESGDTVRAKISALLGVSPRAPVIAEHVAAVMGAAPTPSTSDETSWAIRSTFQAIARARPLVIVFDDVQWGEPAFLDLIESVAESLSGASVLLLCIARPELLDQRPAWGGGKLNATSVQLKPLTDLEVSRLVANLLGGARPSPAVDRKIVEAAEGNPLFVEEFLAMLLEDGVVQQAGDAWIATADLASVAAPPSIMALLGARLDRLPDEERDVLERASVVGKVFSRGALENLAEQETLPDVDRLLGSLVHRELIRPDRSSAEGPESYRFKHILIRDAAYAGLPKVRRVALHERFAEWLTQTSEGGLQQADEVIGAHLEQAYRYLTELGPLDDRARAVGRRGAARLAAVGRRILNSGFDARAPADVLERAAAMLPAQDPERLLLLHDVCESLMRLTQWTAVRRTNDELMGIAVALGLDDLRWRTIVTGITADFFSGVSPKSLTELRSAIDFFEGFGDTRGLTDAWFMVGSVELDAGHVAEARFAFECARDYSRQSNDRFNEGLALVHLASADFEGPAPVSVAITAANDVLAWSRASGVLWTEAIALAFQGRLNAMLGNFDEARRLLWSAAAIDRDLDRQDAEVEEIPRWIGLVEWLAGDPVAAERGLRPGYEGIRGLGESRSIASMAGELARMLYLQGRFGEAFECTETARTLRPRLAAWPDTGWCSVRAMIMARRGELPAAIVLARDAVALAENTDLLFMHARALEDLAEVLELGGQPEEAEPHRARAIRLYDQKGITVLVERARSKQHAPLPQEAGRGPEPTVPMVPGA
jgi:DNA-binding SARP family transcriptional activator